MASNLERDLSKLTLHSFEDDQSSDDDRPLSFVPPQRPTGRPGHFIKPPPQASQAGLVPSDMRNVQTLYEHYAQKVYYEGYLFKKNDLTVDGKPLGDPRWNHCYAELCGPVLILWEADSQDETVMPQYINITDSNVIPVDIPQKHVFALNSAGANRYLLDVPDPTTLADWMCAIRLSCYESARLCEIYTRHFMTRGTYSDILAKPMTKMEGFVQVRFTGSTEWQKYWVVVSDRKDEKKLFGKKSVVAHGQVSFYETKKSKTPVVSVVNVTQAYTLYPEAPQLVDMATMLKIEGVSNDEFKSCYIMGATSRELVQWLTGTFDAFKLYGRPSRLLNDPSNITALNFGESLTGDMPRLFLEVPEVAQVNVLGSLLDNKVQFSGILLAKMSQPLRNMPNNRQTMGLIHQIPSGTPMYNNSNGSPLPEAQRASIYANPPPHMQQQQQRSMTNMGAVPQPMSAQITSQSTSSFNRPPPPTLPVHAATIQPNTVKPAGKHTYASDESEEEDDDDDEEGEESESESEDDAVFVKKNVQTKESLQLPDIHTEDEGFATVMDDINKSASRLSLGVPESIRSESVINNEPKPSSVPVIKEPQPSDDDDDFELSDDDEYEEAQKQRTKPATIPKRPKPKIAKTQVSLSGSDEEDEDDDGASYSGSEDEEYDERHHPQQQQYWDQEHMHQNGYPHVEDPRLQQYYYDENGDPQNQYMEDEDGPVIPQLGDNFATQNSLLDTFRPDHPSARDQEGYARATGQPLIQVPNKPPEPRAGLVGMISQIEHDKKVKDATKSHRYTMDPMEKERERYLMDQRSQMMMNQQGMMGQGMMGQGMMPMMDPRMSMMSMNMMGGQMPMMNMMGGQMPMMNMMGGQMPMMMDPRMMQGQSMMGGQGMMPMMDPRMSMMMMPPYGQYPMWQQQQQQQQSMYGGRFNNHIPEEDDEDEDDDVPLGAKDIPRQK
ncbi:hypothetical protein K501DRAFT_285316 [Backusella circina FSU 941]|nr:hypothetical protein K501DRAFT_285316 [Backusella circina FSU 941]